MPKNYKDFMTTPSKPVTKTSSLCKSILKILCTCFWKTRHYTLSLQVQTCTCIIQHRRMGA